MKKILAVIALLLLPVVGQGADFIHYYPPSGGSLLLPDGTAAAPSLAFASQTDTGVYKYAANTLGLGAQGVNVMRLSGSAVTTTVPLVVQAATGYYSINNDTYLYRDGAANTLALRNSTAAQTFNIYNTYTDASNYERAGLGWSGNVFIVGVTKAGTGSSRSLALIANFATLTLDGSYFYPGTADSVSLGYTTLPFKHLYLNQSIQGSKSKALTDNVATAFATMAMPQTAGSNYGGGKIIYTIFCKDAANQATESGDVIFACHNLAGAEACTFGTANNVIMTDGTASFVAPVFTAAAGADLVTISVQSDCTGVTPTTHTIQARFDLPQVNTLAFP